MSFKTDRLAALFPDVYASREGASILRRLLDAIGAELVRADTGVKDLLKSHWIDYARDGGLDGLGSLLGVTRRRLPDGAPEGDDTFRPLLKSTVSSFIGGGTVESIRGAVRAALGLPYDLALLEKQLAGPNGTPSANQRELLSGLADLVRVHEFAPALEVFVRSAPAAAGVSTVLIDASSSSLEPAVPRIAWSFSDGAGRRLSLLRQDGNAGVVSKPGFEVRSGEVLLLSAAEGGGFSAAIGSRDVSAAFVDLDGSSPPRLPVVPPGASRWSFSVEHGAEFDVSSFDAGEVFDAPAFSVRMEWLRAQPLVFDVVVPFFVELAVRRLLERTGFAQRFKVFQGLSLSDIQRVVDQSRAAGVRGMVQYSVALPGESSEHTPFEDQAVREQFSSELTGQLTETHEVTESMLTGALDSAHEQHDASEHFALGAVFDFSVFDSSWGFQGST